MVLVVVADSVERERVVGAVERSGCLAVPCDDGPAALARMEAGRADAAVAAVRPDGIELVRRIKQARAGRSLFPVILVGAAAGAGADASGQLRRGFAAGCDDFVSGPVNPAELELRLTAQLRRRAEARALDRKKRELALLVVHDLRSPIGTVAMAAELLKSALAGSPPDLTAAAESIAAIESSAGTALSLVGSILDIEELEAGMLVARLGQVRVADLIDRVIRPYRGNLEARGLRLTLEVDPELEARLDRGLIGRVVENLLGNAVRYAPRDHGKVVVRAGREGDVLVMRLGNDGPPVPADQRDLIFERSYRIEARRASARENRGLGLYFCRLAVEAHGGTIAVETDPDLPTVFVVRLPQAA